MIHILTTNPMDMRTIHENIENFVLCHVYQKPMLPYADKSMGYVFKVYHQDGMDLSEYDEYLNEPNFSYEFIPVPAVTVALESIMKDICDSEIDLELDGEDNDCSPDELIFAVCGSSSKLTSMICKYLNTQFQENDSEVVTMNLYKYMHRTKIDQIADIMKMQLNTTMVYEEDPVAFSFVLFQLINGMTL